MRRGSKCRIPCAANGVRFAQADGTFGTHIVRVQIFDQKPPAGAGSSTAADADNDWSSDIGYALIKDGYALVESRRERRFDDLVGSPNRFMWIFDSQTSTYKSAEAEAKRKRLNIWQYGDFTGDTL